ncbi:MAG: hypothetical protein FI718_06770 [SAR202 cluster bacterium]|nr:hypothetical protein [SAR202 cluster bacterium]
MVNNRIVGTFCSKCETKFLPPRPMCAICNNDNLSSIEFKGTGVIVGFTKVAVVPSSMSKAGFGADNPYWTCIICLEEGVNIPAVLDLDGYNKAIKPFIGMSVKIEFGCKSEIYFKPL